MSFETFAHISPTTGVRRLALRAAAVAAAITLAFFPAAAQAQAQTTLTVTTLADSGNGSLRAAIAQSASTPSGQSTIIDFASGLTGTGATYAFEGTINGVTTGMVITPLGGNRYGLAAAGSPVNLTAATGPVAVTLTVGSNSGTAAVKASRLP
jgi:hypothetical protein